MYWVPKELIEEMERIKVQISTVSNVKAMRIIVDRSRVCDPIYFEQIIKKGRKKK